MRRVKKSVVVVTMMLFSMMLFSMTNVHAGNKKLKVNKVYTTTKKIKGKTKKKYLIKVKIGKKIYKKKASSKGNFSIKIPIPDNSAPDSFMRRLAPIAASPFARKSSINKTLSDGSM